MTMNKILVIGNLDVGCLCFPGRIIYPRTSHIPHLFGCDLRWHAVNEAAGSPFEPGGLDDARKHLNVPVIVVALSSVKGSW